VSDDTADADFPTGWTLTRESWQFHRRFYAVFRRPMHRGEYTSLLRQIRHGHAVDLGDNCSRVEIPGERIGTISVRATPWQLITILPKHFQPPILADADESNTRETAALPAL
jgi:hypothetical protein